MSQWKLAPEFLDFIARNRIPLDAYDVETLYRFFRINPRSTITADTIISQLESTTDGRGIVPHPVDWLPGAFFRLPTHAPLAALPAYKNGDIYGIDVSSGAAVIALDPQPGENILDLCCAPGTGCAKLCFIADRMGQSGTVTGVDLSEERLNSCRTMLKKYSILGARLFCADATTFSVLAPSETTDAPYPLPPLNFEDPLPPSDNRQLLTSPLLTLNAEDVVEELVGEKIRTKPKPSKAAKRRLKKRHLPTDPTGLHFCNTFSIRSADKAKVLYDRVRLLPFVQVLLDAQCSLDAAMRHVLQFHKKKMIRNGFRMLKPGGVLVYSTCSFITVQNEDVVQWLLEKEPSASLLLIPSLSSSPASQGGLSHTIRFYPRDSKTSGMFIAKILKAPLTE